MPDLENMDSQKKTENDSESLDSEIDGSSPLDSIGLDALTPMDSGSAPAPAPAPAPKAKSQTNDEEVEDMLGQLDDIVDSPTNGVIGVIGVVDDSAVEGLDEAADIEDTAGQEASSAIRTTGDAMAAPGEGMSEGLKDAADSADQKASELESKDNKSAYEQGLELGYQAAADWQRTASDAIDTSLEVFGQGVATADSAVDSLTEMSSNTTKQVGGVVQESGNELEDTVQQGQDMENKGIGGAVESVEDEVTDVTKMKGP